MQFNFSRLGTVFAVCAALGVPLGVPLGAQTARVPARPMAPIEHTIQRPVTTPPSVPSNQPVNSSPSQSSNSPTTPVVPERGFYTLAMTATKLNGRAAGSSNIMSQDVGVSWSGTTLSIDGGGLTFRGQVTANHLSAASQTPEGTISLSGTPAAHYASGTFTLTQPGGNTASGGFTLTPTGQQHMAQKLKAYGGNTPAPSTCGAWCSLKKWWAGFTL